MTAATLRQAVKEAINETLLAHRDELEDKITEKLEDAALVRAMKAVEHEKPVSRAQVMRTLRGKKR